MPDGNGLVKARWGLKLHSLNASLRLTHYMEHNIFPKHKDLVEHLVAEAREHRVHLEALKAEGEIAQGWRSQFLYRDRLGLSPHDHNLVEADAPGHVAPHAVTASPFATAWRNYIKSVFQKGYMYNISERKTLLYVSENKTLGGKEDRNTDGEAAGRKLVVTFFGETHDGFAYRVDRDGCTLRPQLLNVAEILLILG